MSSCQAWIWLWDKSVPQSSVRAEQVRDVLEMFWGVWGFEFLVKAEWLPSVPRSFRNQVGSGYPWIAACSSLGGTISPSHSELDHQHFLRVALSCACKTSLL